MIEQERKKFERRVILRLFEPEYKDLQKLVIHARTEDQSRYQKYENISHAVRCGIMMLLREELPKLRIKRGRPRKTPAIPEEPIKRPVGRPRKDK